MAGPIDLKTFVWLWKRTINLLDWVGHAGLVHGAILPPHILVFPDNASRDVYDRRKHSSHIIDWCYSVPVGSKLKAWCADYKAFYPPEMLIKSNTNALATDIYMAAKTMIFALGGKVETNTFPSTFPPAFESYMRPFLRPDPSQRTLNRADMLDEISVIAKKEIGAPSWHNLIVPGIKEII